MKYELYEDQERVKKSLSTAVRKHNNVLCYAPTGFGKTILSKIIIDSLTSKGKKVLFTVPRIKLAVQTQEKFGYGNLLLGNKSEDNGDLLTIASVQSLYSRKHTDHYDFIFIDECHFAHGSEYVNYIFDTYTSAKIIGLSATPIDENGYLLRGYDDIVSEVTVKELIEGKRLCDVNVYTSLVQPKLSEVPTVNGDYNQKQASEVVREEKILSNTMSEWKKYGGDMKTLVFASDIKHSEVMKAEFIKLGYNCGVVHSKIKDEKITETYSDFNTNKIQVLINVDMATFGFDEPGIECLLFARPIKSLRLYKQMVGRGLRTFKGKDKCLIIDCANVVMDNGFPTDEVPFIKKPVITKTVDRILDLERETSGEVTKEISKKRIDYLTKVGSLFDLYNQKKYTKESDFQEDVRKFLKSLGFFMWRQNSGTMFKDGRWIQFTDRKGLPDITVIYNGVYIGIELKMKTGAFTKHQKVTIPLMIESGIHVYVVDNFEELFFITESLKDNIVKTSEGILIKNKLLSMSDSQKKYRKKLGIN